MTVTGNDGKKYTVDGSRSITLRPTWDELEQRVAKASNSLGVATPPARRNWWSSRT